MENVVKAFEIAGVVMLAVGSIVALVHAATVLKRGEPRDAYRAARRGIGRAVLLGLEVLIIADIVQTITIDPTRRERSRPRAHRVGSNVPELLAGDRARRHASMASTTAVRKGLSWPRASEQQVRARSATHRPPLIARSSSRREAATTHDASHLDHQAGDQDAAGGGRSGNRLLRAAHRSDGARPRRPAERSERRRGLARRWRQARRGAPRLEPAAVRRHRLSLVHRGGARPDRRRRGPVLRDGVLGQRAALHRHAVRHRRGGRRPRAVGGRPPSPGVWSFGRRVSYTLLTVYAMRMAAVFAISTTTIATRLGLAPRWLTVLGLASGVILLLSAGFVPWIEVVFPVWVFVFSLHILVASFRGGGSTRGTNRPSD